MQENNKAEHSGTNGNMRGSKEQTKENMGRRLSDTMLNRNNMRTLTTDVPCRDGDDVLRKAFNSKGFRRLSESHEHRLQHWLPRPVRRGARRP